jgi:hypothetical protein
MPSFAELIKHLDSDNEVLAAGAVGELIRQSKIIEVPVHVLKIRGGINSAHVMDMSRDEMEALNVWCDWQRSSLWENMSLQEILNVYRVSAEWDTWEAWEEDWEKGRDAVAAWNSAVIDPGNMMIVEPEEN